MTLACAEMCLCSMECVHVHTASRSRDFEYGVVARRLLESFICLLAYCLTLAFRS